MRPLSLPAGSQGPAGEDVDWLIQAVAAAALQVGLDVAVTARHNRWRQLHKIPSAATQVRRFNTRLFALAVATLLYVQTMLVFDVIAIAGLESAASEVWHFPVFGALTAYLWTAARRRWRSM